MAAQMIDVTNLPASDGFIVQGDTAEDRAGYSVSGAGDVNGDGIDDFIIGARNGDDGGTNAGEAYVIFGRTGATRTNIDLTTLSASDGFIIQGDAAGDLAGTGVSGAGDINGDGVDDLIVGAVGGDNGGGGAGEAYVIFGRTTGFGSNVDGRQVLDLTGLAASDGFIIQGDASYDYAGRSVSSAGDVNGDGIDDLIVGATYGDNGGNNAGEAYVIYGRTGATRTNIDLTSLAASDGFIIQGDTDDDRVGLSVSGAGDVNGDGVDDLIVGANYGDNGGTNAGEAYVIFGQSAATRTNIDLTSLAASDGFTIQGDTAGDRAGYSVSSAGDVNGDGIDDLIVGAINGSDNGTLTGEAYVIYGKTGSTRGNIDLSSLPAADGFVIRGASGRAGFSVSQAGDINGDGRADLVVGANAATELVGGVNSGAAYVIFGSASATRADIDLRNLALTDGLVIAGDAAGDQFGSSVSAAGDINGDGIDDLLVGARFGDNGGTNAGEAYIIYGNRNFGVDPVINGTAGADTLTGTAGDNTLNGMAGDDVLIGGGGNDIYNGGIGNDIFIVDDAGDVATEASGEGTDSVETTLAAYTLTANVENLEYTGAGAFNGTGNTLANVIVGGAMGDTLDGGDGNDTLGGEAGNDTLNGGNGADRLNGGTGADTMNGGDGNDILVVDNVGDVANGGAGSDTVQITANITYSIAADIETISILGTGGTFTLNALANSYGGSSGNEIVYAGGGADIVYLRGGNDSVFGGMGNDRLFGEAGIDNLSGEDGNDLLYGGTEGDSLTGGAGNDTLYGEAGNDLLNGGAGIDILNGGAGADRYLFDAGESGSTLTTADRIQGFSSAQGDVIDLGATGLTSFIGGATFGNVAGQVRSEVIGGNTYVMGDVDGNGVADFIVRIDGVVMLGGGDFEFIAS